MKKLLLLLLSACAGLTLYAQDAGREADSLRYVYGRQEVKNQARRSTP